ncbi:MAG: CehA/McbA family metallohydrolase [candidate division WOR-3 bacterium]
MIALFFLINYSIYFANLHSHTEFSDGEGMPAEAFLYARDSARIDILAITDHSHQLTPEEYRILRETARQFTTEGKFIALAGQEFGNVGVDGFGHIDIFEAESICTVDRNDLNGFYSWFIDQDKPGQFNHPAYNNKNFNGFIYNPEVDEKMGLLELLNQHNLALNDFRLCLSKGWKVGVTANQDNHHRHWGDQVNQNGDIPLTGLLAQSLTREDILDALIKGRTYALEVSPREDRIHLEFTVDNQPMGERLITPRPTVTLRIKATGLIDFSRLYIYRNGYVFDSVININSSHIDYTRIDTTGNYYYYVELLQTDGDHAWSSPVWVEIQRDRDVVEIWPNPVRENRAYLVIPRVDDFKSGEVIIGNVLGQRVFYKKITTTEQVQIDCHELPIGVYFVKVRILNRFGDQTIYQNKMAVIR